MTKFKYVIQYHIATRPHYDFRLEWNGVMLSWAIPKGPSSNPSDKRLAIQVEDHPISYNDFEGVIPKGQYGAGPVMIWDEGFWESTGDINLALAGKDTLQVELFGKRLKGKWKLVKTKKYQTKNSDNQWLLIKEKDEYSQENSGIEEFVTSIRTGRTIEKIISS